MAASKLLVNAWGNHGDFEDVGLLSGLKLYEFAGAKDYLAEAKTLSRLSKAAFY